MERKVQEGGLKVEGKRKFAAGSQLEGRWKSEKQIEMTKVPRGEGKKRQV